MGERIGMIGLGNMGGRIARRLVESGREVLGYDVRAHRAGEVGAIPGGSVSEVACGSDYVLLSLPESRVIEQVVFGEGGLLVCASRQQVIIDLSTASPRSTVQISAALAGRGADYLDAGISGGPSAAEKGTLTIMVGGRTEAIREAQWLFDRIAARVFVMGGSGSGHTTKLLNNFLNAVALAATAEVMVAGTKAGLDLETLLEVLNSSTGVNYATLKRFPSIVKGDYLEGGLTGALMMKDLLLYTDLVRELGVPCLNAAGPLASFGSANQLGYGDQISNRVVDAIGDLAGHVRLCDQDETPEKMENRT